MSSPSETRDYRRFVALINGACCIVDSAGVINVINQEAVRLLGMPFKSGDSLRDIIVTDNEATATPLKMFSASSTLTPGSLLIRTGSGDVLSLRCRGGVLKPATKDSIALLMIHFEGQAKSVERFTVLNRKITELGEQVQLRKNAENDLTELNKALETKVLERTTELAETHANLLEASRKAGMAEVATGVLHNVGNILNSVNISSNMIEEQLSHSRLEKIREACKRIHDKINESDQVIQDDPLLIKLLDYVREACDAQLKLEHAVALEAIDLRGNIDAIKQVVTFQQKNAVHIGTTNEVFPQEIFEQTLMLSQASLSRHKIQVVKDYAYNHSITVDTSKLIQILTNLITNARESILMSKRGSGHQLTISIKDDSSDKMRFILEDTGIGITQEQLPNLFTYGYTTKHDGHGFGLHTCAIQARELGGDLKACSDGEELGARFELSIAKQASGGISSDDS